MNSRPRARRCLGLTSALLLVVLFAALPARGASFSFAYLDGSGEGFNDQAPFTAVGGNSATTLGQARRNAFEYAAGLAGAAISSAITIKIEARMDPMGGTANSAVLGSAGANFAYRDFTGAPVANTWYVGALANKLAGLDLDGGTAEIGAQFNSDVDNSTVLGATNWYYGLDGNPGGHIDFVSVVLHELVHGLGFGSLVDLATGAKAAGFDDAYMRYLEHHGATPSDYPAMSDAERVTASKAAPNLHWIGPSAGGHVEMYAPNPQEPGSSVSHFSTSLFPNQLMEPYYTGVQHGLGLATQVLSDMGWGGGSPPPPPPPSQYTLTVGKTGSGGGLVSSNPAGISCGFDCSEVYDSGTSVTLNAAADPGSTFAGWSGSGCTGTGSCVVSMTAARSVTATFNAAPVNYPLSVNKAGSGVGTVTSNPAGINCGGDCSENYLSGTSVTLSAAADPGSTFAGWSGEGCTGTGSCVVSMTAARSVTATFGTATQNYNLTVNRTGSGTGTVTSSQTGIACGIDCSEAYPSGSSITLNAAADPGSSFTGWSGDCSGTGSCVVSMTAARSVTATFDTATVTHELTVNRSGGGSGTVTSSPSGISCGASCAANYTAGTIVTLSAAAGAGSSFSGWNGGGCSGTGSCVVNLAADTAVTAVFDAAGSQSFNVNKNGRGLVVSGDFGILCGPLCATNYNAGANVALTAIPEVGYSFGGWTGGCSGGTPACNAAVSGATTVTANFNAAGDSGGPRVTATANGQGGGTVSSPVTVQYTVRQCTELFVIVNAPAMGINWSYINASGAAVPMPGNLAAVTPHRTGPADGTYTLYSGAAPSGSYELYVACDNALNGSFNFSPSGLNGVFTRLGVVVP